MSTEPEEGTAPGTAVGVVEDGGVGGGLPDDGAAGGIGRVGVARFPANALLVAGIALVAVAAICAVVFGWLWSNAASANSTGVAKTRDAALQAAEVGAVNFTTLDYHNVQAGIDRWKLSATGDLANQLAQGTYAFSQQVTQAKAVTSSKVLQAAVTDLGNDGTARVILVLDVTVTPAGSKAQIKRLPLQAALTSTKDGWKLSALGQIPVGTAGQ